MKDYEEILIKKYLDNNGNELPSTLYHYTTQDGLLGILKKSEIWATDILYLNDAAEFNPFLNLIKKEIQKIIRSKSKKEDKELFKQLFDNSKELDKFQIFVCSFSVDGDLLSQWRSYCPDNNGFSIGFEYTQLKNIAEREGSVKFYLLPCFYYDENKRKSMFNELRDEFATDILNCVEINKLDDINKLYEEYTRNCCLLASILKHESFRDEKEWRLFCFKKPPIASSEIQFRKGKSMLLPYITVELQGTTKFSSIIRIYIGPTPHKEPSIKSVELFVKSKHLSCSVTASKVPYRAW